MERVLFDTNVILDIALKRIPYFEYSVKLFELIDKNKILGHITASTITDIYYISKKEKGHEKSLDFISNLIDIVEIIGIDKEVIIRALKSEFKDFEDAIQDSAAEFNEIECIITRNEEDFKNSNRRIFNPKEFIENFE